ncbi:MAG: hypothetical protein K2G55_11355 [Lachnospiraceae bacterium]|nr:hypothetical protein [Lachnospiraceae bacterium]
MNFLEITIYRIIFKTYMFLEETGRQNSFERFPYLRVLTKRLTKECMEIWQCDTGVEASRYYELLHRICGTEKDLENTILYNALDLCLTAAYVPEFAVYLNYYTGNIVTIQLASELEGVTHSSYNGIVRRLQKLQKICSVDWNKKIAPLQGHAAFPPKGCLTNHVHYVTDDRLKAASFILTFRILLYSIHPLPEHKSVQ